MSLSTNRIMTFPFSIHELTLLGPRRSACASQIFFSICPAIVDALQLSRVPRPRADPTSVGFPGPRAEMPYLHESAVWSTSPFEGWLNRIIEVYSLLVMRYRSRCRGWEQRNGSLLSGKPAPVPPRAPPSLMSVQNSH